MLKVRVNIPSGLNQGARILAEETKHAMDLSTSQIERDAKERARQVTGNLRRAITSDVVPLGKFVQGVVYANMQQAPYAADVEYGTGIYSEYPGAPKKPITPKTKKALAFMVSRGAARPSSPADWRAAVAEGKAIITKSIKGSRPQPFMRPAFDAGKVKVEAYFRDAVTRAKERMST